MSRHDHIRVTYMPAMIRIDGDGKMNSRWNEISEELGRVMTPQSLRNFNLDALRRMVMTDDNTVMLFGEHERE